MLATAPRHQRFQQCLPVLLPRQKQAQGHLIPHMNSGSDCPARLPGGRFRHERQLGTMPVIENQASDLGLDVDTAD